MADTRYRAPSQTVALGPNETATVTAGSDWKQYENLVNFDIRNGNLEQVVSLLIKPTIETRFHWVPIADLAPADGIAALDGFIRSHIHHLNVNGGGDANRDLNRKLAIVLGTIRAVSTTYYRITEADLIAGEVAQPYLAARRNAEGRIVYNMAGTTVANDDLTTQLTLSATEQSVIAALVQCGVGVIPMQGYSLIMTGHHYLSDNTSQSRKCYQVVEAAYWRATASGTWFQDNITEIQDAAWHKSTHPVQMSLKQSMAMDEELPKKLKAAQAGACASRLPAAESELRAANSYLTCIRTVSQLITMMDGSIDYLVLEEAAAAVAWFPAVGAAEVPKELSSVPPEVTTRTTALKYLGNVLVRSQTVAAFCYGFYCAMVDQNQTLNTQNEGLSLKTSNSLSKLVNQCYPNYVAGQQFYGDYVAARNAQRVAGTFIVPKLVIA